MDFIPSIFQFDQSIDHQELCQIISNNFPNKPDDHNYIQTQFEDNHLINQTHPLTPSQEGHEDFTQKRRRSSSSKAIDEEKEGSEVDDQANPSEKKKKNKVLHREIERQRRKEMAGLYADLRSLIPLQHLKGKRSISDQMHVAVNYIKEMQRKNQELMDKRDTMEKNSNSISISCSNSSSNDTSCIEHNENAKKRNDLNKSIISVTHSREGIEIAINTACYFEKRLSLARVLRVVAEQGLNIVSCVSAKVNDRFLHTIESEAVHGENNLDLAELEKKLKYLIV